MRRYAHLFFDLDHTLWDFETNSRATLVELYHMERLVDHGVPDPAAFVEVYEEVNKVLWDRYENGKLDKAVLRVLRFRNSLVRFGVKNDKLAVRMGRDYLTLCPRKSTLMAGAKDLLEDLRAHYQMHIITNGFDEVQRVKLEHSAIAGYFDVVLTSEMAGARKPHPKIFQKAQKMTRASASQSLMIGDSVRADIEGARAAGWDQAHFAPGSIADPLATYGIGHLDELRAILL